LGKDFSPRFLVGELCGSLQNQGFQERIDPSLLPESNLVIQKVQVFSGVFVLVVGPPVGDIPKKGEDGVYGLPELLLKLLEIHTLLQEMEG